MSFDLTNVHDLTGRVIKTQHITGGSYGDVWKGTYTLIGGQPVTVWCGDDFQFMTYLTHIAAGSHEDHKVNSVSRQSICRTSKTGKTFYFTHENLFISSMFPEVPARIKSMEYMYSSSLGPIYWYLLWGYARISISLFDIFVLWERRYHELPKTQFKCWADGLGTLSTLLIFTAFTNNLTGSPIFFWIGLFTWL